MRMTRLLLTMTAALAVCLGIVGAGSPSLAPTPR